MSSKATSLASSYPKFLERGAGMTLFFKKVLPAKSLHKIHKKI